MSRLRIDEQAVSRVRDALGVDFSQDMVARINDRLDVDVLVIDIKGDAYAMKVANRQVLVTKRTTAWFRQNFSLAHELGHIASNTFHFPAAEADALGEVRANAFAAELLMPEDQLRTLNWATMNMNEFAQRIWDFGISTEALVNRLSALKIPVSSGIEAARAENTFALLRHFWTPEATQMSQADPITLRREKSAQRYIPTGLISHLELAVLEGRAPKESLAFLLAVPVDEIDLGIDDSHDLADDISLLESIL